MKKCKYFLLLFILLFSFNLNCFASDINSQNQTGETLNNTTEEISTYSPACLLMEASTGKILYEKNAYESNFPASTTKIMTAILTLENCELTDIATVSYNAIISVPSSYVNANLHKGEELTIEQLLNILLIPSANDAANVLAEHIAGSVEEFAKMMNEKAKEIGCLNTNFVNPNGVHNKNHTTTAYDLALMGKYAMQFPTFRELVKKTNYTLPATNKYDKADRIFTTSNELIVKKNSNSKDNYYYENAIGIKTGYTSEAGSCIVAGAEKDGLELIVVVLGGTSTKDGLSGRYLDCRNLFDYGFNNYKMETVNSRNSVLEKIPIRGGTSETKDLNVLVKDDISIFMSNNENIANIKPEIVYNDNLKAPVTAGSVVGNITYKVRRLKLFF